MTIHEFIAEIKDTSPPAPSDKLADFEAWIGHKLPDDYRGFVIDCNGGYVGGRYWFQGKNPEGQDVEAGVHHIGGFREESYFSLPWHWDCYRGRIPAALIWINDDHFGNAICLGLAGKYRGRVYFWDHENEPDEDWDGSVESAHNITLIANSFTDFVAGVARTRRRCIRETVRAELVAARIRLTNPTVVCAAIPRHGFTPQTLSHVYCSSLRQPIPFFGRRIRHFIQDAQKCLAVCTGFLDRWLALRLWGNEPVAQGDLALLHIRKHGLDVEIVLRRKLLTDTVNLGDDRIFPHRYVPISSSGVQMIGIL